MANLTATLLFLLSTCVLLASSQSPSPSPASSMSPAMSPSPASSESPALSPSPASSESPELSPSPASSESPSLSPSPASSESSALSPSPASSESPELSPAIALNCDSVVYNLMPCLNYVSAGSNDTAPEKDCCAGVAATLKRSPLECLCSALQEAINMGMSINMTRAVALPEACSLKAPELHCQVTSSPGLAPAPVEPSPEPSLPPKSSPVPPLSPPAAPPASVLPTPVAPVVPPTITPETPALAPSKSKSMAAGLLYSPLMVLVGVAVAIVA